MTESQLLDADRRAGGDNKKIMRFPEQKKGLGTKRKA